MEILISIISMVIAFVSISFNMYQSNKKSNNDETTAIVSLKSDLKYITKTVDKINDTLEELNMKIQSSDKTLIQHEKDIKVLYKYHERLLNDVERLKNESNGK